MGREARARAARAELRAALTELRPKLQAIQGRVWHLAEHGPEIPIEQRLAVAENAEAVFAAMLTLLDRMVEEK